MRQCIYRCRLNLNRVALSNAVIRAVSGSASSMGGAMWWSIFSSSPAG